MFQVDLRYKPEYNWLDALEKMALNPNGTEIPLGDDYKDVVKWVFRGVYRILWCNNRVYFSVIDKNPTPPTTSASIVLKHKSKVKKRRAA